MYSNFQPISRVEKKKSSEKKYGIVFLAVGIIFCVGFVFLWYQGFFVSTLIIETQSLASSESTENVRFGNADNIIPNQIEPRVSEPVLENFDQIPKPSKVSSKEP